MRFRGEEIGQQHMSPLRLRRPGGITEIIRLITQQPDIGAARTMREAKSRKVQHRNDMQHRLNREIRK